MSTQYYSQLQLAPYRGVMHVVETGGGLAFTVDGGDWRVRLRDAQGRMLPGDERFDADALRQTPEGGALALALAERPALPFARADRFELWLLAQESGLPLALLQSRRAPPAGTGWIDAAWRAFASDDDSFHAECLGPRIAAVRAGEAPPLHRDVLERQVNDAARPLAALQWFERSADGGGIGLQGNRIGFDMQGRVLASEAFPELIVAEDWRSDAEERLVREYHDWIAARLLMRADLSCATRARLERAAAKRPRQLLEVCRLIFEFVDRRVLDVALVQVRIAESGGPVAVHPVAR